MNFLMLIPGIFELLEKIVGPLLSSQKGSIVSSILAGSPTAQGVIGAIEGVIGNLESSKQAEFKAQLETLLAQSHTNDIEAQSEHFFNSGWRPFLAWGLGLNIVAHATIISFIDVLQLFGYNPPLLTPIDTITLSLMTSLLGIYMTARTVEKYSDSQ